MAHREDAAGVLIAEVLPSVPGLEGERARLYVDLVLASLSEAARIAFEALMQKPYEYQTEFVRKWAARDLAMKEMQRRAQEESREVLAEAVLDILDVRGLEVDAESRARIVSCGDLARLKVWIRQAITVPGVSQLFE